MILLVSHILTISSLNGIILSVEKTQLKGVAEVFKNSKRFLTEDYNVFVVANDKFNMYPTIADIAGMQIVNQHQRPVLNRTEKNRESAYSESIFHLKEMAVKIVA